MTACIVQHYLGVLVCYWKQQRLLLSNRRRQTGMILQWIWMSNLVFVWLIHFYLYPLLWCLPCYHRAILQILTSHCCLDPNPLTSIDDVIVFFVYPYPTMNHDDHRITFLYCHYVCDPLSQNENIGRMILIAICDCVFLVNRIGTLQMNGIVVVQGCGIVDELWTKIVGESLWIYLGFCFYYLGYHFWFDVLTIDYVAFAGRDRIFDLVTSNDGLCCDRLLYDLGMKIKTKNDASLFYCERMTLWVNRSCYQYEQLRVASHWLQLRLDY